VSLFEGGYNSSAQALSPLAQSTAYHANALSQNLQKEGALVNYCDEQVQI
jgi:hypothetical protein